MAGVDPYATFRISLQAKVSSNLPFGFQDPAFAPLNSKIFAPENVSQLAIWDSQANPTAAITAWVTPVQGGASAVNFIQLLKMAHIDHPNQAVMKKLQRSFSSRMLTAATPDDLLNFMRMHRDYLVHQLLHLSSKP